MFGTMGFSELIIILVIVLIIFGAGRLPQIGEGVGKALKGFKKEVNEILSKRLDEKSISQTEIRQYKSAILHLLGQLYAEKNWVMQLHLGPIRDTNKAILTKIGRDIILDLRTSRRPPLWQIMKLAVDQLL